MTFVRSDNLPSSLSLGAWAASSALVVEEATGYLLTEPLTVVDPGGGVLLQGDAAADRELAAGTAVCAYLVHVDPVLSTGLADLDLMVTIDFGSPIVGLVLSSDGLDASHDFFEVDELGYGPLQGLDQLEKLDEEWVELDWVQVQDAELGFYAAHRLGKRDQLRVLTAC
jgi:hypothetical protein